MGDTNQRHGYSFDFLDIDGLEMERNARSAETIPGTGILGAIAFGEHVTAPVPEQGRNGVSCEREYTVAIFCNHSEGEFLYGNSLKTLYRTNNTEENG
jgi:hypothetical protein